MLKVYLDNAATTRPREKVLARMNESLQQVFGNPSSTHSFGRTARTEIETARKTIAKCLNAHPSEIIFTSGGTETDNMVLRSAVRDLGVKTLITSKIEHHAILHTAEELEKEYGIAVSYVGLDAVGNPDLAHLEELLKNAQGPILVSLMHVNNELGNILDIRAVAALCKEYGALFHSDTVQSIGHYQWDVKAVDVDFLSAAAHKFHGPKGIGFAYIKKGSGLRSLIFGGEHERGLRAGTEPAHAIVAMETALQEAMDHLEEEKAYVKGLKVYFMEQLASAIPGIRFNGLSGDLERSTYTMVNVWLPFDKQKSLMLLFHLDMKGIACSKGSACQSGSDIGSHVLTEILSEKDMESPSIRFSFSIYNTKEELDYVVGVLKEFAAG